MKTEHLLIIRFSALGDVAMTVPIVSALAHQYPSLRITVLSRPFARVFFDGLAPNVGFMGADLKGEYRGIKGLNALYRRLTAKNFTAIADFHAILRSSYLRMRFNIDRYRVEHINKHRAERRALTAPTPAKRLRPIPTAFEGYADVLARLGYPVKPQFTSIFTDNDGSLFSAIAPLTGTRAPGEAWIGIAPFAAHAGKVYPIEKMEQVIALLGEQVPGCRLFLFGGGKDEQEVFGRWQKQYSHCVNASERLGGLHGELVLMSRLDAMLSMDSANMHLASLVGTTVVSVWGATHPYAGFMGWNQSAANAVQLDLPCRPCSIYGNKPCLRADYACLNGITPQSIVDHVKKALAKAEAEKAEER